MSAKDALRALEEFTDECIQCDVCLNVCELLQNLGLTPGEIAGAVVKGQLSDEVVAAIQRCAMCGLCSEECLVNLKPQEMMAAARELLIRNGVISALDYDMMLVDRDWNFFSIYRDTYGIQYQDLVLENCDTLFFPGCTLSCYAPELTRAVYTWLAGRGGEVGFADRCCAKPLFSIGLTERGNRMVSDLQKWFVQTGARRVVTACPNCFYKLQGRIHDVQIVSINSVLRQAGLRLEGSRLLAVHDSCPDRHSLTIGKDIRTMLGGYPLKEMEHHGENTICCGSGGIVSMIDPDLCEARTQKRIEEFQRSGAEQCITACMSCSQRLSRYAAAGQVLHYLELIFDIPIDYDQVHANIQAMWEGEWGEYNRYRLSQAQIVDRANEGGND